MGATLKRLRAELNVTPTAQDKGLTLTITVTAYDNGLVQVNGTPINSSPEYEMGHGWLGAAEVLVGLLGEFRKQAARRRQRRDSGQG